MMAERYEVIVLVFLNLPWSVQVNNETNITNSISEGKILADQAEKCDN